MSDADPVDTKYDFLTEEKLARALYGVQVNIVNDQVSRLKIDFERIQKTLITAVSESDRSAAILVFSLLDDLMIEGIIRQLNPSMPGGLNALFDGNGMFSTASSRINFLIAMMWIRKPTYQNLSLVRKIRNRFSHTVDAGDFKDSSISGCIHSISKYEQTIVDKFDELKDLVNFSKFTNRDLFLLRSFMLVSDLIFDLAYLPYSLKEKVNPGDVHTNYDDRPENMKNALRAVSRSVLEVLAAKALGDLERAGFPLAPRTTWADASGAR